MGAALHAASGYVQLGESEDEHVPVPCVPDPETLAKLLAAPEDRAVAIAPLFRSLGGELLGYWYVLGGVEVYVMFELPDDVAATGMSARVASSGAFASPTCTRLMTVQETLAAQRAGRRYRLPRTGEA
jgi:uncharacterized protein with GYD domain